MSLLGELRFDDREAASYAHVLFLSLKKEAFRLVD